MLSTQFKTLLCIVLFFYSTLQAQQTGLKGIIVDAVTNENLTGVVISIESTTLFTETNPQGVFDFNTLMLPLGEQIIAISKTGYLTKRLPITINEGTVLDLRILDLEYDVTQEQVTIGTVSLSENELDDDNDASFTISGLLQASRDVFLNAAAFDFGATFFRPRGLGNENGKVLINGIEMNTLFNGRPQWSTWGGLNDVQRNQEFSMGMSPNPYTFGDLSGTTNIIMRASQYRKGGRISYASSNRSYTGRIMGTYNSGLLKNGWAYAISLSRRFGNEGFIAGTLYDANSIFVAIEKQINKKHTINLTSFYTPNRRGRSTAITEEAFDLKGRTYNPNWGYQNGDLRNSRIRKIEEPVTMLNHYWNITKNTTLNTNVAFQTGKIGNARIDNSGTDLIANANGQETYIGGGTSRDINPTHPANLPGFYLQNPNPTPLDFQNAFLAQQRFSTNGQLDWDNLVLANQQNTQQGNNATYIVFEDRTDHIQLSANSIFSSKLTDNITLNGTVSYQNLKSENFAEVTDLLGGTGFLDIDPFAFSTSGVSQDELADRAQSDLQHRNRIVGIGDRYDYNYEIEANTISGFAQAQFNFKTIDFFLAGKISQHGYQRNGLYENGYFPGETSFGKSEYLSFINYGAKAGITYTINGHHFIKLNGSYFTKAPTIRNAFVNARQNNITIAQLVGGEQESEKIQAVDASYIFRSPKLKARLTGYYTKIEEATDISFFFTQAISGSEVGFVQEILTGIDKVHIGGELGIEYQVTPTLKLKGAAAIGQFTYDNNPDLILTSTSEAFADFGGIRDLGTSALENYHIAGGPQRAAQLGFEYRDPDFWWFGATTNYFSNAYIDISPFARTNNFNQDIDGLPFSDYDENIARGLLRQERFNDYFLVNVVGGKSWRIKKYYVGFFATINNVLNTTYKTGGFEQSRNANYRLALQESQRKTPIFGPRYFFGAGTSYYFNIYIRF